MQANAWRSRRPPLSWCRPLPWCTWRPAAAEEAEAATAYGARGTTHGPRSCQTPFSSTAAARPRPHRTPCQRPRQRQPGADTPHSTRWEAAAAALAAAAVAATGAAAHGDRACATARTRWTAGAEDTPARRRAALHSSPTSMPPPLTTATAAWPPPPYCATIAGLWARAWPPAMPTHTSFAGCRPPHCRPALRPRWPSSGRMRARP